MNTILRNTPDIEDLDKKYLFHPFTALAEHEKNGPSIIVKGEGVWLEDNHGNKYIDGMAGLWCVNVGYGRKEIADVLHQQAMTLPYFHSFSSWGTEAPVLLAEKIISKAPAGMSKVFFGQSGSDANDTQVKLVWYYWNSRGMPQKKKIIARNRGYHGVTIVAGSLTGMPSLHSGFDLPLDFVRHTTAPYRLWEAEPGMSDADFVAKLANDLEQLIEAEGPETIGAMIMEPVMGAGGVIVPPSTYWPEIKRICAKYQILLVADEVICGFGRLGTWFGHQYYDFEPDLAPIAKGLSSGYLPIGGVLVSDRVAQVMMDEVGDFYHGYTYSGHPVAAAAALENIRIIEEEGLVERVRDDIGPYLAEALASLADHDMVGEAVSVGLMGAVQITADKATRRRFVKPDDTGTAVRNQCVNAGVVLRATGDRMLFSPPLIISRSEIDQAVGTLRNGLDWLKDNRGEG